MLLAIIWVGIAIGVLIALILIIKLRKTSRYEAVTFEKHCEKCGYKTNGLKCPRCDKKTPFDV